MLKPGTTSVHINCSVTEKELFFRAAQKAEMNMSDWAKRELNIAAGRFVLGVDGHGDPVGMRLAHLEKELRQLKERLAIAFPSYLNMEVGQ